MIFLDSINYKIYENSPLIITMSATEANKKFTEDLQEIKDFFKEYGLDAEKALYATEKIWKKHLVTF